MNQLPGNKLETSGASIPATLAATLASANAVPRNIVGNSYVVNRITR